MSNLKVYTAPEWLMSQWNDFKSPNYPARIIIPRDRHGRPIIGVNIKNDPTWDLNTFATSPEGVSKPIIEWLEEIDYEPINTEEE
jgi:hypothetical protein